MKKKRLKTIEEQVKGVLAADPITRGDDFILVLNVYKLYGVPLDKSIDEVLRNHNKYGLPSFASIVRTRRKLQVENPSLVNKQVKIFREEQEQAYLKYATE